MPAAAASAAAAQVAAPSPQPWPRLIPPTMHPCARHGSLPGQLLWGGRRRHPTAAAAHPEDGGPVRPDGGDADDEARLQHKGRPAAMHACRRQLLRTTATACQHVVQSWGCRQPSWRRQPAQAPPPPHAHRGRQLEVAGLEPEAHRRAGRPVAVHLKGGDAVGGARLGPHIHLGQQVAQRGDEAGQVVGGDVLAVGGGPEEAVRGAGGQLRAADVDVPVVVPAGAGGGGGGVRAYVLLCGPGLEVDPKCKACPAGFRHGWRWPLPPARARPRAAAPAAGARATPAT